MSIKYDKLIQMMKDHGINSYTVKRDKIIGQATYKKIMSGEYVNLSTIDTLCRLFNCQPGDLLEYVEDNQENRTSGI